MKVGVDELILGSRPRGAGEPLGAEWVDVLRGIPLFAPLSKRHVKRIANLARPRRFAANSPIVTRGDPGESFFVILDGEATLSLPGRKNVTLGSGDSFGELALLDGGPRTATARVVEPTVADYLPRDILEPSLAAAPPAAFRLMRLMAGRLRQTDKFIGELTIPDPPSFD